MHFHSLIRAFLLSRQADGLSPRSIEWHQGSLQSFTRWIESNDHPQVATEWTPTLLREYIVFLQASGLASATVTSKVQSLLAFTRWLHEEEFTGSNVGARVKKPKPMQKQPTPFTSGELKRLLEVAKASPRDHAALCLLIDCGLRATELCTLRVEDVMFDQCLVKVSGKGNKQRVVPFSAHTAKSLARWLARCDTSKFAFPASDGCLATRSLHSLVLRLAKRAEVDHAHPHRFRHTFAVSYLRNGGDPLTLQRMLGHTSLTMTNHYVNMSAHDLKIKHEHASPLTHLIRKTLN